MPQIAYCKFVVLDEKSAPNRIVFEINSLGSYSSVADSIASSFKRITSQLSAINDNIISKEELQNSLQDEYYSNSEKYIFVVIEYSNCVAWQGSKCIEREIKYIISEIDKIAYSPTENDKYKIMDDMQAFAPIYGDNYVVSRDIFVFNTYAEASKKREKCVMHE